MSLPDTFKDIMSINDEGVDIVILNQNIIENGDRITIPANVVESWLASPVEQSDKVQVYLNRWKAEGRY